MSEEVFAYFCATGMAMGVVAYGVILIFVKDLAWKFQDFNNRSRGLDSKRTPEWERMSTITGAILIGAIMFMIMLVIFQ